MKHRCTIRLVSGVVSIALTSLVFAGKPAWVEEKQAGKKAQSVQSSEASGRAEEHRFSGTERRRVQDYFDRYSDQGKAGKGQSKGKKLPPGLQKKFDRGGELPPGWQKKVAAGQVLDRDLYAQSEPLPDDLDSVLETLPGEEHRRIGNKVVRVLEGDGTIVDVIEVTEAILGEGSQ